MLDAQIIRAIKPHFFGPEPAESRGSGPRISPERNLNTMPLVEDLIRRHDEYLRSIQPIDIPAALGEERVTIRVPFIMPREFNELADYSPPRPGVPQDLPLWFSLDDVSRKYPNITVIRGDDVDDLFVVRDGVRVYLWPEVYSALSPEDRMNVQQAVWALHVWEPEQRRKGMQMSQPLEEVAQ